MYMVLTERNPHYAYLEVRQYANNGFGWGKYKVSTKLDISYEALDFINHCL